MIAEFAVRLIFGMSLCWCLMDRKPVTSGYFRIQMLVTLGLSVLAALVGFDPSATASSTMLATVLRGVCIVIAVSAFVGSVMWILERRWGGAFWGLVILFLASIVLGTVNAEIEYSVDHFSFAFPGGHNVPVAFSSAFLLGSNLAAMLLGHWYLTATGMPIEPLKQLNRFFGVACIFRAMTAGYVFWKTSELYTTQLHWIWLSLHWMGSVIGPLLCALAVWRILKYRNTQSATGVLFAATVLVFMGEMTAALLMQDITRAVP